MRTTADLVPPALHCIVLGTRSFREEKEKRGTIETTHTFFLRRFLLSSMEPSAKSLTTGASNVSSALSASTVTTRHGMTATVET